MLISCGQVGVKRFLHIKNPVNSRKNEGCLLFDSPQVQIRKMLENTGFSAFSFCFKIKNMLKIIVLGRFNTFQYVSIGVKIGVKLI